MKQSAITEKDMDIRMKRTILASDYDGTFSRGGLTEDTLEAVRRFRAAGGLFGIVTGRDWRGSWQAFSREGKFEFDFIVSLNGALAFDRAGELLFETAPLDGTLPVGGKPFARSLAETVFEVCRNSCGFAALRQRFDFHPDCPDGGTPGRTVYLPHSGLDSLSRFYMANTRCETAEEAVYAAGLIAERYGAYLNPLLNGRCIDLPPAGTDKGEGVARLAKTLGVDPDDVWTAGDNYNDLAMLARFHGCAMNTGVDAAKEAAEYVCDGIAGVVDTILNEKRRS